MTEIVEVVFFLLGFVHSLAWWLAFLQAKNMENKFKKKELTKYKYVCM